MLQSQRGPFSLGSDEMGKLLEGTLSVIARHPGCKIGTVAYWRSRDLKATSGSFIVVDKTGSGKLNRTSRNAIAPVLVPLRESCQQSVSTLTRHVEQSVQSQNVNLERNSHQEHRYRHCTTRGRDTDVKDWRLASPPCP